MDIVSSSDEEDDRKTLIHQDDSNNRDNHVSHQSSTFQIDAQMSRRFTFFHHKRYLFAILLPIFILLVFSFTDIINFFSRTSIIVTNSNDPLRKDILESESQALYLLKRQQSSLFTLLNRTDSTTSDDLKSAVFKQIALNREIQQALLLSHRVGNLSGSEIEDSGFDMCRKVDQDFSGKRTIEWKPRSNKYLFAICVSGQMSNRLICLEKHMFFAALLNRVLVIPSSKVDYQYDHVLDIDHVNKCLGRKAVISFEEFSEMKKNSLRIDRVMCYFSLPQPCYLDDEHVNKLKSLLGLTVGKLEPVWIEDIKKPKKRMAQDVVAKFSSDDEVIAIGDVFFADLEQDWVKQPGGPLAHKCKTLIEPSRLIIVTAQRFVQTFLGKNFAALHFRRHGFLKFCNAKAQSCFFPIPQAAECISWTVERAHTPVIYLSTDAADSETSLLKALLVVNGKTIPLVTRPARNSAEKWDALIYRHGLQEDPQVEAMLDKTICALSSVFIGSPGSTFTEDILRLRKDWGSSSPCDEYLCQGELPSFIADDE